MDSYFSKMALTMKIIFNKRCVCFPQLVFSEVIVVILIMAAMALAGGPEQLATVFNGSGGASDNTVAIGGANARNVGAGMQPGGVAVSTGGGLVNHAGFLQAATIKYPGRDTDGDGIPDELDWDNDARAPPPEARRAEPPQAAKRARLNPPRRTPPIFSPQAEASASRPRSVSGSESTRSPAVDPDHEVCRDDGGARNGQPPAQAAPRRASGGGAVAEAGAAIPRATRSGARVITSGAQRRA
jgi:hypothetical protein